MFGWPGGGSALPRTWDDFLSTQLVRGQTTIYIPRFQQQYAQVVDDPEQFRGLLDRLIDTTPELFPPEIRRGYRMKDIYQPRKTPWELRWIGLRNGQSYLVRPSFLMPYLTGRTEDVQPPLPRNFAVPFRALAEACGRSPMYLPVSAPLGGIAGLPEKRDERHLSGNSPYPPPCRRDSLDHGKRGQCAFRGQ